MKNEKEIKKWFVTGRGIIPVKLLKHKTQETNLRGLHTLYLTGTKKEFEEWSDNLFFNYCHTVFKAIDCGEIV